jgi:hypothetical protein
MAYDYRDKIEFLTASTEHKGFYDCPNCGKHKLGIDEDGKGASCLTGLCKPDEIRKAIDRLEGKPDWKPDKKSAQAKTYHPPHFYPARDGSQLAKTSKTTWVKPNGEPDKSFSQAVDLGDGEWVFNAKHLQEKLPERLELEAKIKGRRKHIPIYRYAEVQTAIAQAQQIFVCEGEKAADALWSIGIPATTTIGGSNGYKSNGDYSQDLTSARLVLCPDRDQPGLKYIANFARDFNSQIEGYCLAGEIEGWSDPRDSRDLADDILDRHVARDTILASITSVERFTGLPFNTKPETTVKTREPKEEEKQETIAERVLKLAFAAEYFCTPDKATYADIRVDGVRETHSIRSRAFRLWLTGEFYDSEEKAINSNAMAEVLGVLDAKAVRSKVVQEVNLRTAEHQGKVYLDLGSPDWSAIEVDAQGWRVVAEPPVRFTRPESLLALPTPIEGGSLYELKELINVDGDSWILIITFLLFSLCPNKTYPVLVLAAVRGSGKTAAAEILKGLIDPGKGGLIKLQNDIRNLAAAAVNRWLMVYDNVGYISADQSDDLCRMATNFGFSTRTLHTTAEETTLEFTRPQIITAIDALVTRDDLADRVLMAQLGEITEDKRLAQGALAAKVEAARPRILGAMLTALSKTLAELPNTKPEKLPRMADYALFSIAAEKTLGLKTGEFLKVFNRSREQSRQVVLEASPLSEAILKMMENYPIPQSFTGEASQLLAKLEEHAERGVPQSKAWPRTPIALNRQLDRLAPDLKEWGIEITRSRTNKGRFIHIQKSLKILSLPSFGHEPIEGEGLGGDKNGDSFSNDEIPVIKIGDSFSGGQIPVTDPVSPKSLQGKDSDGSDRNDGNFDPFPDKEQEQDLSEYLDEV